jgi:Mg2+/Co2+ transporter CorB
MNSQLKDHMLIAVDLLEAVVEILIRRGPVSVIDMDSLWHNIANHEYTKNPQNCTPFFSGDIADIIVLNY